MADLRPRTNQILLLAAALLIAANLFYWQSHRSRQDDAARLATAMGAVPLFVEAPNIRMFDRSERAVLLESYRGRVVLVNFWATWCGPCLAEMPSLIALQRTLDPRDIAFVSISEDDTWPPFDAYLRKNPLPFDLFRDRPPRVEDLFEVTSYPTTFLIDAGGQALYRFNGARDWDTAEVRELFALTGVRSVGAR